MKKEKTKPKNKEAKIMELYHSPEMQAAIKLLYVAFKDLKLESHLRFGFTIKGEGFKLCFYRSETVPFK